MRYKLRLQADQCALQALFLCASAYSAPVPTRLCYAHARSLQLALPGDLRRARAALWAVLGDRNASAATLRATYWDPQGLAKLEAVA